MFSFKSCDLMTLLCSRSPFVFPLARFLDRDIGYGRSGATAGACDGLERFKVQSLQCFSGDISQGINGPLLVGRWRGRIEGAGEQTGDE